MDLNRPMPFTPNKNQIDKDWLIWKKEFLIYLRLSGAYEKCTEEGRALLLINLMGTEAIKAMENMSFDHPNERNDMDILMMKFDEIFDPPRNEAEERYKFFSRMKGETESIENYVADLKDKATKCNFGAECDKFIIDNIIRSMDRYLREMIFAMEDITLLTIVQQYRQFVISTDKIKELSKNLKANLNSEDLEEAKCLNNDPVKPTRSRSCWRCGTQHDQGLCPAYGKKCSICNEKNHLNGKCQKESTKRVCSNCGTNHPYMQCPAHDETCGNCFMKGHYTNKCKRGDSAGGAAKVSNDRVNKKSEVSNSSVNNQNETHKPSVSTLKDCPWCESKHREGQCQHDTNCTRCTAFPHNICFNCKENPHSSNCYYKSVITLPQKQTTNNNLNNSNTQQCSRCGLNHGNSTCTANSVCCHICKKFGHFPNQCFFNPNKQNLNAQSTTTDPLLKDYVTINNNQQTSYQTQPQRTQCSTPQQAQYSTPQQTQYSIPRQTQYSTPQQAQYSTPQQAQYSTPEQTQYSKPQQTQYSKPQQTQYRNSTPNTNKSQYSKSHSNTKKNNDTCSIS